MSRLDINREEPLIEEHNDGFEELGEKIGSNKVLVIDADTIAYWGIVGYNPDGSKREFTIDDLPELEGKISEIITGIINKLESYFTFDNIWIFIRGENNFRKLIYPLYKSNRPQKHELIPHLYSYMEKVFKAVPVTGYEAEDACATIGRKLGRECVIAYCDHDLLEVKDCILYNYQKGTFRIQTEKEALWEKYKKLNLGEPGDGCNLSPSYGLKKFEANFHKDMTEEEYEKETFNTFLYCWADKTKVKNKTIRIPNVKKATEMLNLAKKVLWLAEVELTQNQ